MKRSEYIYEAEEIGRLRRDNPGGSWLAHKKQYAADDGRHTSFGGVDMPPEKQPYKYIGTVTGYTDEKILIPVEKLTQVNGLRGEQSRPRPDSLEWLRQNMEIQNGKVFINGREHAPFINVDQDGVPWVNEGNHRIMVAAERQADAIYVEVRWYNGGEDIDGNFSPKSLGLTGSN